MSDLPFKHLTLDDAREYVRLGESGDQETVWERLGDEARGELVALAAYGRSTGSFRYDWHLDQVIAGSMPDGAAADVQSGLEKMGLSPQA